MSTTFGNPDGSAVQPPPHVGLIRDRLEQLHSKLTSGSTVEDYKETLRLIGEIKRAKTPPPQIDIGSAEWAAARIAYAIDSGALHWKGADISPLLLRYEYDMSWWLKRYATDSTRPKESRSFVATYFSAAEMDKPGTSQTAGGDSKRNVARPVEKVAVTTDNAHWASSEYRKFYPRSSKEPTLSEKLSSGQDLITSRIGLAVFLAIVVTLAPIGAGYFTGFVMNLTAAGILLLVAAAAFVLITIYALAVRLDRRMLAAEDKRALEWFSSREGILLRSAAAGDLDTLRTALADGGSPDVSSANGMTPLMLASAGGHTRMVHLLLDAGSDPNLFDAAGRNALVHAAINRRVPVVRHLIKHGARPEARNAEGKTALMATIDQLRFAAQPEHLEIVRDLTAAGLNINQPDNTGRLPIIAAVEQGSPELVRTLLDAGADPNCVYAAPNAYEADVTPLLVAAYLGEGACVELLLRAGADHRVRSMAEITPLMLAAGAFKDDKARDDEFEGRAPAALKSRLRAVRALIAAGADINARDEYGGTAVTYATHMDRDAIIRVLADAGADLDATDEIRLDYVQQGPILTSRVPMRQSGVTALMYAAGEGRTMAAIALVELGANMELKNSDGLTALEIARKTNPSTAAAMSKAMQATRPRMEVPAS